jgi:hypothetical protein
VKTAHLPISPSKTLLRFADQIAAFGKGPVLDAPCGYGRNAIALASKWLAERYVSLCVDAQVAPKQHGVEARVISMPSLGIVRATG